MKKSFSFLLMLAIILTISLLFIPQVESYAAGGYEIAYFPMQYLNITQGVNGSFSHQGTLAIDLAGKDSGKDAVYAPFTGVIKKIYTNSGNFVWLESSNPVLFADGTIDYMTIMIGHDNDVSDLYVGKVIKQGEHFYSEGDAGYATGNHIHLECAKGKFKSNGWYENSNGNWMIYNTVNPFDALVLKSDVIIKSSYGYNWRYSPSNIFSNDPTIAARINEVLDTYGPGDYFTKNGNACTTCHNASDVNCVENGSKCNCLRYPTIDGKTVDLLATQCFGYARYWQQVLFGSHEGNSSKFQKLDGTGSGLSYSKLAVWIYNNQHLLHPGTHIRVNNNGHSLVLLDFSSGDQTITFIECNWDNKCGIEEIKTLSFDDFASRYNSITYAQVYKNYHNDFSSDAPNTTLTISYNANGGQIENPTVIGTLYKVTEYANVRSGPGMGCSEIGRFDIDIYVSVTETETKDNYVWGKVDYYGTPGWVALGDWMVESGDAYSHYYYVSSDGIVSNQLYSTAVNTKWKYGTRDENGLYNNTTFRLYKNGYEFSGWSLKADGSGAIIDQDEIITPESICPSLMNGDQSIVLYAVWEKNSCDHEYEYTSAGSSYHIIECTKCGEMTSGEHDFSNDCDTTCGDCGHTRTITHTYDNACDKNCNVCGATRTTSHTYTNNCDTSCNVCGHTRTITHTYDNACDKNCNVCGATRTTSHTYSNSCDTSCNVCGATRTVSHTYTNDCDKDCNDCGATRTVGSHTFDKYSFAFAGHWKVCSICGEKESDAVESHTITPKEYYNKEWHVSTCTVCNAEIAFDHVFTNDCDPSCNDCTYERTTSHSYTNSCDKTCNKCNEERAVVHTYTDICDEECNVCGEKRTDFHAYGEWNVVTGATCTTEGTKVKTCSVCGDTKEEKIAKIDHKLSASQDGSNIKHECLACDYSYTTPLENVNNGSDNSDASSDSAKVQQFRETTLILGGSMIIGLTMMGLVSGLARRGKGKSKKDD